MINGPTIKRQRVITHHQIMLSGYVPHVRHVHQQGYRQDLGLIGGIIGLA